MGKVGSKETWKEGDRDRPPHQTSDPDPAPTAIAMVRLLTVNFDIILDHFSRCF